ncbi:MAG: cytochrome c biogenesis protein DipZ [Patescibacteria group bacterium]
MILLVAFSFFGGIVTILSPCILPILPIVLSGSITGGKHRPWGVIMGFIASFTFFTLFLSVIVKATNISADLLRTFSIVIIAGFGLSLIIPSLRVMTENLFSKLSQKLDSRLRGNDKHGGGNDNFSTRSDFAAGLLVGLSLGLLWTPCVGPILASIITLAAASKVTTDAVFITLAYAAGTALPLLAITYGGRSLLTKNPWLVANTNRIQKGFGVLMILTAIAIYFQVDRTFQSYILNTFPSYGVGLTKFEDNTTIKNALQQLQNPSVRKEPSMVNKFLESDLGNAPELILGGVWFNVPSGQQSLSIKSLRGQVVLIDFWTYTCINCIRTLPYLKSWHDKYKDKGLTIIGIHTPEFEFEKNPDNVSRAIRDFGITYPVMQDNDFATWNAYANHYWPAKYLVDKNGKIRYTHFGEGDYDETETKIQELLKESGTLTQEMPVDNPTYQIQARTPETYLGNWRIANIASPERIRQDVLTSYSIPGNLSGNSFAFGGAWTVGYEYARPTTGGKLSFRFDAKDVFLVMRPTTQGVTGSFRVLLDGKSVSVDIAGEDVRDGVVHVDRDRLYTLIKLTSGGEHTLELQFLDGNNELYAFTFG